MPRVQPNLATAPQEVPPAYIRLRSHLGKPLQGLLDEHGIPYCVQARLANNNIRTVRALAQSCTTSEAPLVPAKHRLPQILGITPSDGFEQAVVQSMTTRLASAVEAAKHHCRMFPSEPATPPPGCIRPSQAPPTGPGSRGSRGGERASLEFLWEQRYGAPCPPRLHQGSDRLLTWQLHQLADGKLGWASMMKLIPPDAESVEGSCCRRLCHHGKGAKKYRPDAAGIDACRLLMLIFHNTLLLGLLGHPEQYHLQVTKPELQAWYSWLWETHFLPASYRAGKFVPWRDFLLAERKAWKIIDNMTLKGTPLRVALRAMQSDTAFWGKEVRQVAESFHLQALLRQQSEGSTDEDGRPLPSTAATSDLELWPHLEQPSSPEPTPPKKRGWATMDDAITDTEAEPL